MSNQGKRWYLFWKKLAMKSWYKANATQEEAVADEVMQHIVQSQNT